MQLTNGGLTLARWQAGNSSLVTTADKLPTDKETLALERQTFFSRLGNQLVKAILRSPLHGLVGGNIVLITVTGRKSGKAYTTPVRYWRQGDMLTILSRRNRTWWRNVCGGSPVTLRLQGKEVKGWGTVTEDDQGVVTALAAYLQQVPRRARRFGVTLDPDGQPRIEDMAQPARTRVVLQVEVSPPKMS